jgi:hypothetical protein
MRMKSRWWAMAGGAVALLLAVACRPVEEKHPRFASVKPATAKQEIAAAAPAAAAPAKGPRKSAAQLYPVAPPPFSDGVFPCSECHGKTDVVNRTPHKVEFHEDIVLHHDEQNRWCLDCHDAQNRDKLHLADGRLIDFTESYRLCGQCHGPTLRNWKAGEHGKRTGSWSGDKQYLLCASCHSPHSPHFKPIKPKPAPRRQEAIR